MRNEIAIVIPYFGRTPRFTPLFVASAARNSPIDFLLFFDHDANVPAQSRNIRVLKFTADDFNRLASQKLGHAVKLRPDYPYKLCDFKSMYGRIFEDFLTDYSFWGWADIDQALGNVSNFFTQALLDSADIVSGRSPYLSGAISLFRNGPELRDLYAHSKDYLRVILEMDRMLGFTECGPSGVGPAIRGESLSEGPAHFESMTSVVRRLQREKKLRFRSADYLLEGLHREDLVHWDNGRVLRTRQGKILEFLSYHWVCEKNHPRFHVPQWESVPTHYFATRTGFYRDLRFLPTRQKLREAYGYAHRGFKRAIRAMG